MDQLFVGQIVHSKSLKNFEIFTKGFVAIKDGKIINIGQQKDLKSWQDLNESFNPQITLLTESQFLIPGFIDCHIHAPQMPNIGLGLDMELLDWLNNYTFPIESEYKNAEFAQHVYEKVIKRTLSSGTTLATYFATNYANTSVFLAKEAIKQGQRAFVGKVSSNCCCPTTYVETTEQSLIDNKQFIKDVLALKSETVKPIITPRFALSCNMELLKDLAAIAKENDLHIQSHISENIYEVKAVVDEYKMKYAEVYDAAGLLTNKTIMAHGVHLEDSELKLFKERGTSVAHCPISNTSLKSGFCDVKRLLENGIRVGLGTDVSGGNQSSILSVIRETLNVSIGISFVKNDLIRKADDGICTVSDKEKKKIPYIPISYKEAIYLATLGGAEALEMDKQIGNFECGKDFDGLLVETFAGQIDEFNLKDFNKKKSDENCLLELVQKFIYVGDDRNILKVYVKGKQVK